MADIGTLYYTAYKNPIYLLLVDNADCKSERNTYFSQRIFTPLVTVPLFIQSVPVACGYVFFCYPQRLFLSHKEAYQNIQIVDY